MTQFLEYYSRNDVQKIILNSALNREAAVKYSNGGFGKRPDTLQFENDIFELAKQGATSFHISEEHWSNPLLLKPGMTKPELDRLRIGFDIILDIDTKFIEYSRETALLLIKALRHYNIKNIGLKFSGGSGFHLGIPFSSLPQEVNGKETRLLFPEVPRAMAAYIKDMIKPELKEKILSLSSIQEIKSATGKEEKDLLEGKEFNPFSIIEIDTILISNRHMYRAPYSINEKKGLVSVVVPLDELKYFNLKKARIENIKKPIPFLPETKETEASSLVIQSLDEINKRSTMIVPEEEKKTSSREYDELKNSIPEKFFPHCIELLLKGIKEDGRKRALFILLNFLKSAGYPIVEVEKILKDWNQRNAVPLGESYVVGQISWHKRQDQLVLPPNCSNENYYKDLGVKCPEEICSRCKNPINYTKRRFFAELKNKPKIKPLKKGNKTKDLKN